MWSGVSNIETVVSCATDGLIVGDMCWMGGYGCWRIIIMDGKSSLAGET